MNNRQSNQNSIPNNFNWKIIPYIANDKSINNEQKAKNYFKKNCKKNSQKLKLYYNKFYNIPNNFDDNLYIEYLKSIHDVNLKPGEIDYEKLCIYYNKVGKHKYPLNNSYFKLYYNLPENFDEVAYKDSYKDDQLEFNSIMNKYTNIFEFYGEVGKEKYPINDNYFKIKFKLPEYFDYKCYKNNYNLNMLNLNDTINHYLKNKKLDENYFKLYYEIPENFDKKIYKQYSKISDSDNDLNLYFKTVKSELEENKIPEDFFIKLFQLNKDYTINNLIDSFPELNKNLNYFNIYNLFVKNKEKYTFKYSKYGKKNENDFINILTFFEYNNDARNIIIENKLKSELDFLMWYLTNKKSYKFNNGNETIELEDYKSNNLSDMDNYLNIASRGRDINKNSKYLEEIDKIKMLKTNNYMDLFDKEINLFLKSIDRNYDFNIINKINEDLKEETIFYKIEEYLKKTCKFDVNYIVYNKFINEYISKYNNKIIIILSIDNTITFKNLIDSSNILNKEIDNYNKEFNFFKNDYFISFVKKNEFYNSYCKEIINPISKFLNSNEIINKDFSFNTIISNNNIIKIFYIKNEIEDKFNNSNFNKNSKNNDSYHYFILDEIDLDKYYLMYLLLNCNIEGNIILHVNKNINFDFLKNKNISFEIVYIENNLIANDFMKYVISNDVFKPKDILINSIYIFDNNIISTNLYVLEKNNFMYVLGIFLIGRILRIYNNEKFCLPLEVLQN